MAVVAPPPAGIPIVLPPKAAYNNYFPGGEFNAADIEIDPSELLQDQHFELVGDPYMVPMPPFGMEVQNGKLRTGVRVRFPNGTELDFPIDSKIIKKPNIHFEGFYIELQSDDQGQPIQIGGRRHHSRSRATRRSRRSSRSRATRRSRRSSRSRR